MCFFCPLQNISDSSLCHLKCRLFFYTMHTVLNGCFFNILCDIKYNINSFQFLTSLFPVSVRMWLPHILISLLREQFVFYSNDKCFPFYNFFFLFRNLKLFYRLNKPLLILSTHLLHTQLCKCNINSTMKIFTFTCAFFYI